MGITRSWRKWSRCSGTSPTRRASLKRPRRSRQATSRERLIERQMVGRQLGPYTIVAPLGAGGMGEVYRAHDSKLGRDVAIKILPSHFTADPERRSRFAREARLLATLNHPHIGAIYGLEDIDGVAALILELVEGPTLADRLARGPLPIAEALAIARQLAEALDAAHEKGIVHRDLKPANIVLQGATTASGPLSSDPRAKVLDFGLGKTIAVTLDGDLTRPAVGLESRHRRRAHPRNAGLHEPRAGAWPGGGQAHGHLGVRVRPVTRCCRAARPLAATRCRTRSSASWNASPIGLRCPPRHPLRSERLLERCLRRIHGSACTISPTHESSSTMGAQPSRRPNPRVMERRHGPFAVGTGSAGLSPSCLPWRWLERCCSIVVPCRRRRPRSSSFPFLLPRARSSRSRRSNSRCLPTAGTSPSSRIRGPGRRCGCDRWPRSIHGRFVARKARAIHSGARTASR